MIREELTRLFTWEERHRRLAARLLIAFGLTLLVLAVGSVLIWAFESGVKGGDIVALHRLISGLGFIAAVRDLGGRFHD